MSELLLRLSTALTDRYRLERELGAGGMATVYLARDLKHDRQVAIKVLKPELAAVIGAERFLSEIKTTANLQHPHILPLFDSGTVNGTVFYAMPFVDGESLRDKLAREKQLPIEEALRIAREVADALQYAHERGVIHRDIKPENILLQGGHALVADFGIALAASNTGSTRMTETGMSLGTPTYMSPEQAMGERTLDARTDVYALGCVLYEMLTGDAPYTGSTAQAIVAKVLTAKPASLCAQRDTVPLHVEDAVLTALAKLPADRFATAREFVTALTHAGPARSGAQHAGVRSSSRATGNRLTIPLAAALFASVAVAAWGWLRPEPQPPTSRQQVVLWEHAMGDGLSPGARVIATQSAIAPDGSSIVYSDSTPSGFVLMRKLRGAAKAEAIAGTQGGISPFFSPDGQWIGFVTMDGKLRKVPVAGGGTITLAEDVNEDYKVATWLDDGTIVYSSVGTNLTRLPASGETGKSRAISLNTGGAIRLERIPGSNGVLITYCGGNCASGSSVYVRDFAADSSREVVPGATGAWYSSTGHLLYTDRGGGLFAVGFDASRLVTTSSAVPIVAGVSPAGFAISASGDALYTIDPTYSVGAELLWVDRAGRSVPYDSTWRGAFEYPALSPDGATLAVSMRDETTDLWLARPDGSRQKVITEGTASWRPFWMPDGQSLLYVSLGSARTSNDATVWQVPADLSSGAQLLQRAPFGIWEVEVSRNGEWMIVRIDEENGNLNFRYRRMTGDTALKPLLVEAGQQSTLALSPDGQWLAYASTEGGRYELYVASFPSMASKRLISRGGGVEPRWSRNGRELFFESNGQLMVVDVPPGPTLAASNPRVLFSLAGYRRARNRQQYDVAPDGRFIMIREAGSAAAAEIMYVQNFSADILAKMKP